MSAAPFPELPRWPDRWQTTLEWTPTADQQDQFQAFYQLILTGNQQLNLTRITEPTEFWEKHLWDSLKGLQGVLHTQLSQPLRSIDIGTGCGFPGMVMAIVAPPWHVTLLDSTRKKVTFLQEAAAALGLKNVDPITDRAEHLGQLPHHRETYDLVTVRAVAAANICAEYALPLLKPGGLAVLYRGQWSAEETTALSTVVETLGGTIAACESFTTPLTQGVRHCLQLRKTANTPAEFPRAIGVPTQMPL